MTATALPRLRNDGLVRTTLRIGPDLPGSMVAQVVQTLQRVPGVLTVDADAELWEAYVAHDAGVAIAALVIAANRAGFAAEVVIDTTCSPNAPVEASPPLKVRRDSRLAVVGLAAMLAIVLIDFALPTSPDKRWLLSLPIVLFWAFIVVRATFRRHS